MKLNKLTWDLHNKNGQGVNFWIIRTTLTITVYPKLQQLKSLILKKRYFESENILFHTIE